MRKYFFVPVAVPLSGTGELIEAYMPFSAGSSQSVNASVSFVNAAGLVTVAGRLSEAPPKLLRPVSTRPRQSAWRLGSADARYWYDGPKLRNVPVQNRSFVHRGVDLGPGHFWR